MAINFGSSASGLETQKYASNICRVYHFEDATHNISIPNQAAAGPIVFNFTKADADTNIILVSAYAFVKLNSNITEAAESLTPILCVASSK